MERVSEDERSCRKQSVERVTEDERSCHMQSMERVSEDERPCHMRSMERVSEDERPCHMQSNEASCRRFTSGITLKLSCISVNTAPPHCGQIKSL